ncbi:MAG: hypothetical protein HY902_08265 [Deltaproteobacteria bacterium]|nr:hypothetical protein [Deltaproteobacteria bacterium]
MTDRLALAGGQRLVGLQRRPAIPFDHTNLRGARAGLAVADPAERRADHPAQLDLRAVVAQLQRSLDAHLPCALRQRQTCGAVPSENKEFTGKHALALQHGPARNPGDPQPRPHQMRRFAAGVAGLQGLVAAADLAVAVYVLIPWCGQHFVQHQFAGKHGPTIGHHRGIAASQRPNRLAVGWLRPLPTPAGDRRQRHRRPHLPLHRSSRAQPKTGVAQG